jgi:hypothetical protein
MSRLFPYDLIKKHGLQDCTQFLGGQDLLEECIVMLTPVRIFRAGKAEGRQHDVLSGWQ